MSKVQKETTSFCMSLKKIFSFAHQVFHGITMKYQDFEVRHPHCVNHIYRVNEICTRHTVRTQLYYQEVVH